MIKIDPLSYVVCLGYVPVSRRRLPCRARIRALNFWHPQLYMIW